MPIFHPPRSVIRVAGAEAGPFLDALLTNDVSAAAPGRSIYAGLLTPQGKLVADVFAHRGEDGAILLDVAHDRAGDLKGRLMLYRLRRKIEIDDVSSEQTVEIHIDGAIGLPADPRWPEGGLGARVLTTAQSPSPAAFEVYEAHRIAFGAPDPAVDAGPEEVFALEALFEEFHGVDFQKGCFIGQENVSRMKRRATTRRKFCRVTFKGPAPAFGTVVTAGPAEIGATRSAVAGVGIALVRLDRAREAIDAGVPLIAGETPVTLDPPDWLLMPEKTDAKGDA